MPTILLALCVASTALAQPSRLDKLDARVAYLEIVARDLSKNDDALYKFAEDAKQAIDELRKVSHDHYGMENVEPRESPFDKVMPAANVTKPTKTQAQTRLTKCLNTYAPAQRFNLGQYRITKANLVAHLMGDIGARVHEGKFRRSQLKSLTLQQLDNLHSNDHLGRPFVYERRPVKSPGRGVGISAKTMPVPQSRVRALRQLCPA